jgi:hypothetical protein
MIRAALVLVALAACEQTPYITTPLDGGVACGQDACGGGSVCIEEFAGVDSGVPNPTRCFTVPDGCYVFDCSKERCSPCFQHECAPTPVAIVGRSVYCEGQ